MSKHLVEMEERDLKLFVELLSFHESELLKQIEECNDEGLIDVLEQELDKCIATGKRLFEIKSFRIYTAVTSMRELSEFCKKVENKEYIHKLTGCTGASAWSTKMEFCDDECNTLIEVDPIEEDGTCYFRVLEDVKSQAK